MVLNTALTVLIQPPKRPPPPLGALGYELEPLFPLLLAMLAYDLQVMVLRKFDEDKRCTYEDGVVMWVVWKQRNNLRETSKVRQRWLYWY